MLHRMCGDSVNKAVHVVVTIYCVHLVGQCQKLDLPIPVFRLLYTNLMFQFI